MIDELKPCPFCGGEVRLQGFDHFNTRNGEYVHEWAFWHHCLPMGKHRNVYGMGDGAITIESAYFETREDAIAAWNRRGGVMSEFKWHDMRKERPELGRGNYVIVGNKGGLYFARRFEGYGEEVWFRDTRGNHHYPEEVQAWAEVPKYEGVNE